MVIECAGQRPGANANLKSGFNTEATQKRLSEMRLRTEVSRDIGRS